MSERLSARIPPLGSRALELARELGSVATFSAGLRLTPRGQELTYRLGIADQEPARSVRLMAGTPPDTAYGIERLIGTPGVAARLKLIARELTPSRGFMRPATRLARRGRLGLIGAYGIRPVELLLKLPRGIAAWLRVTATAPRRERQP